MGGENTGAVEGEESAVKNFSAGEESKNCRCGGNGGGAWGMAEGGLMIM